MNKVSTLRILGYSSGTLGFAIFERIITLWLFYFYTTKQLQYQDILIAPVVFGVIQLTGRILDAISDPLVAHLSDRIRIPFGKRRIFIVSSCVPLTISLIFLFMPSTQYPVIYAAVMLNVFYLFFTAYQIPLNSQLPALTYNNEAAKINILSIRAVFGIVGVALVMVMSPLLLKIISFQQMILCMSLLALVFCIIPGLFQEPQEIYAQSESHSSLSQSLKEIFEDKKFKQFLLSLMAFWFGFNIISQVIPHIVTVLMKLPESEVGIVMGLTFGITIVFTPIMNILCKKKSLSWGFRFALILFAIILPLLFFVNAPPFGLSPEWYGKIVIGLCGIPLAGLFTVPDGIISDLATAESQRRQESREALLFGTIGFVLKVNFGLSTIVLGFLTQYLGQNIENPMGIKLAGPVAAVFALLGVIVFRKFEK